MTIIGGQFSIFNIRCTWTVMHRNWNVNSEIFWPQLYVYEKSWKITFAVKASPPQWSKIQNLIRKLFQSIFKTFFNNNFGNLVTQNLKIICQKWSIHIAEIYRPYTLQKASWFSQIISKWNSWFWNTVPTSHFSVIVIS